MSGSSARICSMNSGPRGRSGCSTGSDSSSAICLIDDATRAERERPCGRSGCVTTPMTSNPSPSKARSGGAANSGVPQKRTLIVASELFPVTPGDRVGRQLPNVLREVLAHRRPLGEGGATLEEAEVVDEQLSMEMVNLVLQTAREQIGGFQLERLAVAVHGAQGDAGGAVDVAEHFGNREAAFLTLRRTVRENDLGVHDNDRIVLDVDDRQALGPPYLGRGEADAPRGVHGLEHVVGQATQLVGHAFDGLRFLSEDRRAQDVNFE